MKTKSLIWIVATVLFTWVSCKDDVVEDDMSKRTVIVDSPKDGFVSSSLSVGFYWEASKGALKYEIQVVKPNFAGIQNFVLDSNVTGTHFNYTFSQPGQYQWRIRAKNGSSATGFTTYGFSIDSTQNLTNQKVVLITPLNKIYSNQLKQLFHWQKLNFADEYRFELYDTTGVNIYTKAAIKEDTTGYTFSQDGVYKWRVKAQNGFSITNNYNEYTLNIDQTAPNKPTLQLPAKGATLTSDHFTLQWTRGAVSGAPITDSMSVYADSTLTSAPVKQAYITATTYNDSLPKGKYYWRVRSIDAAGNKSLYSDTYNFTLP